MLSPDIQMLMAESIPWFNETCVTLQAGENCSRLIGYLAVYRIGFTMVVFHVVMMIVTFWVTNGNSCRASLHNGFWLWKAIALVGICIGTFYIPSHGDQYFGLAWMYVGMVGGSLFIVLQLVLLVDFAHRWHGKWYGNAEGTSGGDRSNAWCCALYFCATMLMTCSIVAAVLLYVFYTSDPVCIENKLFIVINGVMCVLICILSVLPCAKRANENSGLLQGSLISLYVMYLTWSALISEPAKPVLRSTDMDDSTSAVVDSDSEYVNGTSFVWEHISCGPRPTSRLWQMVSGYIAAVLMMIMAVYAIIMTTHRAKHLGIMPPVPPKGVCCCCAGSTSEMIGDRGGQPVKNDEAEGVVYSYSFFHFIFALGNLYIMMQLTMWYRPEGSLLREFGRNWPSVWVKMASSWLCLVVYMCTLCIPKCLPGHDYSFIRHGDKISGRGMLV